MGRIGTTGEALRRLALPVADALAETGLSCSLVLDGEDRVLWASPAFAALGGRVEGRSVRWVFSCLGFVRNPAALDEAFAGLDEAVIVIDTRAETKAWRLIARTVSGSPPAARVLAMIDVSHLSGALEIAERRRAVVEERLKLDAETGLPNERRLVEALSDALAPGRCDAVPVGLMLVDALDFQELVELYGADIGTETLRRLADTLLAEAPSDCLVARGREHEFAIVFPEAPSTQGMVQAAERLTERLCVSVPTPLGSARADVLLAMTTGLPGTLSAEQMLNNARIALGFRELPRRARQIRVYEPEMRAALEARSRTYAELLAALDHDQIEPFFQPQIRLSDGAVTGVEVLVRWRHPEQGLVPPGLFLEIAEETGLLARIDDIVMRKALACLAAWDRAGHRRLGVSLNCTGEALRDPVYVERLGTILASHGLAPGRVGIEILETVFFGGDEDAARSTLDALRARGFRLEIDDFGTGQASVSHLITLGADTVKLDRSLVRDILRDRASRLVVEAVLALSKNLGLATLAEGVETEAQLDLLASLGCDGAQGFGIARPMSFEDASTWLERRIGRAFATAV